MAHHGLEIGPPVFAALAGGAWDGLDFGQYGGQVVLDEERLVLYVPVPPTELFGPLYDMMSVRNQPSVLHLADGSTIKAGLTHMASLGDQAARLPKGALTSSSTITSG